MDLEDHLCGFPPGPRDLDLSVDAVISHDGRSEPVLTVDQQHHDQVRIFQTTYLGQEGRNDGALMITTLAAGILQFIEEGYPWHLQS